LGALATAVVVYVGGRYVLGESITPGVLVAFVLYIDRFFEPIRDLSRRFDTLQSTMAGGERILELLNTPVEVWDAEDAGLSNRNFSIRSDYADEFVRLGASVVET